MKDNKKRRIPACPDCGSRDVSKRHKEEGNWWNKKGLVVHYKCKCGARFNRFWLLFGLKILEEPGYPRRFIVRH